MVKSCCVYKCSNRFDTKAKERAISFFRFPKDRRQRKAWIKAVNRKDWLPNQYTWICSEHFIGGWRGYESDDENYAPTLFDYQNKKKEPQNDQSEQLLKREKEKETRNEETAREREETMMNLSLTMHNSYCAAKLSEEDVKNQSDDSDHFEIDTNISFSVSTGTQSDPDPLLEENLNLKRENRQLQEKLNRTKWGVNKIKDNDCMTKFYTGNSSPIIDNIAHYERKAKEKDRKKSSRRAPVVDSTQNDTLETTPEFKTFVSKKLSQFLDSQLEETTTVSVGTGQHQVEESGIKMFSSSKSLLNQPLDEKSVTVEWQPRRRKRVASSSSSEEEDRLAEAAVSYDFILKESRLGHDNEMNSSSGVENIVSQTSHQRNERNPERECERKSSNDINGIPSCNKKPHKTKKKKKRDDRKLKECV